MWLSVERVLSEAQAAILAFCLASLPVTLSSFFFLTHKIFMWPVPLNPFDIFFLFVWGLYLACSGLTLDPFSVGGALYQAHHMQSKYPTHHTVATVVLNIASWNYQAFPTPDSFMFFQ